MTLAAGELLTTGSDIAGSPRVSPRYIAAKSFAAVGAAPTYLRLTPVAYDESVDKWVRWTGLTDSESVSIAVDATGGTWEITIEGQTTTALAFNISAANLLAALLALPNIGPGDIASVTGGPGVSGGGTPYVIKWGGKYLGTDAPTITTVVTGTPPLLTGGAATAAVTTTAGVAKTGADKIKGFIWPDSVVIDASNDVVGSVLLAGDVDYGDVVLFAGESATTTGATIGLKDALRKGMRELGFNITGLDLVR